ncbi:hypothetical protein D3C81_1132730 [compost metagenome]
MRLAMSSSGRLAAPWSMATLPMWWPSSSTSSMSPGGAINGWPLSLSPMDSADNSKAWLVTTICASRTSVRARSTGHCAEYAQRRPAQAEAGVVMRMRKVVETVSGALSRSPFQRPSMKALVSFSATSISIGANGRS